MFIRTKKIKNRHYAYLVKNSWNHGRISQKTKKYLGRVHSFERKQEKTPAQIEKVRVLTGKKPESSFKDIISELVKQELENHEAGTEGIKFEEKNLKITRNEREVVVGINNGFMCQESLKKLLNYKPERDPEGFELARCLITAGLKVQEEEFVMLFDMLREKESEDNESSEEIKDDKIEFYY